MSALYAYQREGAEWLASQARALLAWQMGTGKTPTSVAACDLAGAARILVLCPAVARPVWRDAFLQWSENRARAIRVLHSAQATIGPDDAPGVLIVSYDLLSRDNGLAKRLSACAWDVLIADEGHALKNPATNRTRAVYGKKTDGKTGIAASAKHAWILTGTPVLNHANELWPHLRALAPDTILYAPDAPMPYGMFTERYCQLQPTPFGNKIVGSRNQADLAQRMARFMSQKRIDDVIKDMPALTVGVVPVSIHDAKVDRDLLREFNEAERAANELVASAVDTTDPEKFLDHLRGSIMALAAQRRLTGLLKAPVVAELVAQDLANNDEKMIVFAHHAQVIDKLMDLLAGFNPVKIDGRTPDKTRENAVLSFQNAPHCRVFVGQLQAASTAITLTASRNVLMAEADWTPAINDQAIRRAYRIGQRNAVNARFVALEGTMDAQIMKILARKTADNAALMDAHNLTQTAI